MKKIMIILIGYLLLIPIKTYAYTPINNDLVKSPEFTSVYYIKNGNRYSFPFLKTYQAYYGNSFSSVKAISTNELAQLPLKGNVLLPDISLVKITSLPKVYKVITKDGIKSLEWIPSEQEAIAWFGQNWASEVIDVPDVFFMDYQIQTGSITPDVPPYIGETSTPNNTSGDTYSPPSIIDTNPPVNISCSTEQFAYYEPYNRCITKDEACKIVNGNNSYYGGDSSDGKYICYCQSGYEWAYAENTPDNYCKEIVYLDSDNDGIENKFDLNPNGGDKKITKVYYPIDYKNNKQYRLEFSIPYDWYTYYVQYSTHQFTENYSNLHQFITTSDPTIIQIANELKNYETTDPNICITCVVLNFVQNLDYIDDFKTGYDEYPKYPTETLMEGNGDCEDTSFLMATILRAIGKNVILTRFSNHLGVGVEMSDIYGGFYYIVDGKKYFYLETTGYYEIGEAPESLINQYVLLSKVE